MKISVIIPTLNAEGYIKNLLDRLLEQTSKPDEIIIIDSYSTDKTKEICDTYKEVKFIGINKEEFDHGGTRNRAAREAIGDILIFMTQDAYPKNNKFIEKLIEKIGQDDIVASYGKQEARTDATVLEKFARNFNYSDVDIVKSKEHIDELGIKTFFLTNVCSAFLKNEFWDVDGFPEETILNEDMIISSKLILKGKKVFYASKAVVVHSHNYTYKQQFKRNFDIGVSLTDNKEILKYAKSESEGVKYVNNAIKHLFSIGKMHLIPHLIIDSGFKFVGYRAGIKYNKLPKKLVKKMSMHSYYFNNKN